MSPEGAVSVTLKRLARQGVSHASVAIIATRARLPVDRAHSVLRRLYARGRIDMRDGCWTMASATPGAVKARALARKRTNILRTPTGRLLNALVLCDVQMAIDITRAELADMASLDKRVIVPMLASLIAKGELRQRFDGWYEFIGPSAKALIAAAEPI